MTLLIELCCHGLVKITAVARLGNMGKLESYGDRDIVDVASLMNYLEQLQINNTFAGISCSDPGPNQNCPA